MSLLLACLTASTPPSSSRSIPATVSLRDNFAPAGGRGRSATPAPPPPLAIAYSSNPTALPAPLLAATLFARLHNPHTESAILPVARACRLCIPGRAAQAH